MINPPKTARELVLRAMAGSSAQKLAADIGTTERTVHRWLANQCKPPYEHTMRMLRIMYRKEET